MWTTRQLHLTCRRTRLAWPYKSLLNKKRQSNGYACESDVAPRQANAAAKTVRRLVVVFSFLHLFFGFIFWFSCARAAFLALHLLPFPARWIHLHISKLSTDYICFFCLLIFKIKLKLFYISNIYICYIYSNILILLCNFSMLHVPELSYLFSPSSSSPRTAYLLQLTLNEADDRLERWRNFQTPAKVVADVYSTHPNYLTPCRSAIRFNAL